MLDNNFHPDRIFCSAAYRARLTWVALNQFLSLPETRFEFEEQLYSASLDTLIGFIESRDNVFEHIAIIGHNPGLTELCNYLASDNLDNLPTYSVYSIQLHVNDWRAIAAGCRSRLKLITPRMLKET